MLPSSGMVSVAIVGLLSGLGPRRGLADLGPALHRVATGQGLEQDHARAPGVELVGRPGGPPPPPFLRPAGAAAGGIEPWLPAGASDASSGLSSRTSTSPSITRANSSWHAPPPPEV